MKNIGLQLYTVRDLLATDEEIERTLATIKEIGYDSVQFYGDLEFLEKCAIYSKKAGLDIVGVLENLNDCEDCAEELFAFCHKYQMLDIGLSTNYTDCQNLDAYIARVNAFAAKAKQAGLTVSYHNHGHEFIKTDSGDTIMQRLMKGFDKEMVDFMPDTYWIHDGGYDVRYFLEQVKGRVKILHLKDLKRTPEGHTFAEVGSGNLYFEGIIRTALECGTKRWIVEQDFCEGDPMQSIKQSYQYIMNML